MASKYSEAFAMPERFPETLKDFTREVLREVTESQMAVDPRSIYAFGAQYFEKAAAAAFTGTDDLGAMSRSSLESELKQLFEDADADHNGFLDRREFAKLFESVKEEFRLSDHDILDIMSEADENDDGVIEYQEFVPIALDIIESIMTTRSFDADQADKYDQASRVLHGMNQVELEQLLESIFNEADSDGNGFLDRAEFKSCLQDESLGLTRREINVVLSQADKLSAGVVTYTTFLPFIFELLVKVFARGLAQLEGDALQDAVAEKLTKHFEHADTFDTGALSFEQLKQLLRTADLGLRQLHINAILSYAEEAEDGTVDYRQFVRDTTPLIANIVDTIPRGDGDAAEEESSVAGMGIDEFAVRCVPRSPCALHVRAVHAGTPSFECRSPPASRTLPFSLSLSSSVAPPLPATSPQSAFRAAFDADTATTAERADVRDCLAAAFPELAARHIQAILSMFTAMGDGLLNIEGAAGEGAQAFEMLIWLQSEESSA
jgi:Ca2+-binding EF-hand superfamily protein